MGDMIEAGGIVPTEGIGQGNIQGAPDVGKLSFLRASWINQRVMNVANRVDTMMDRLIDYGLFGDGYFPFEQPLTDDMLARMAPEQFAALYATIPTAEGKAQLLGRMEALKLPLPLLLPRPQRAIAPNGSDALAFIGNSGE